MRTLAVVLAMLATVMLATPGPANAGEINAFISTAIKSVTDELLPPFERMSGDTVHAIYAPPGALLRRFEAGEPGDIFLTGSNAIDQLIGEGKVLPGRTDLAKTGIGICIRKDAPKPDVSTVEAFKRTLLAAKSVAFASPASGSITAPHILAMFAQLGIADQMTTKSKLSAGGPNGRVSVLVSNGEAEIGLQQASELLSNPDVEVIGMLPGELQQTTIYSGGISASAKNADGARALIKALTTPEAVVTFKSKGLDPL
jgi:molybdate transport system substrate-binding protein